MTHYVRVKERGKRDQKNENTYVQNSIQYQQIEPASDPFPRRSQLKPKRSGSGKRPRALFRSQHLKYALH
jgi:hypothetical protein